MSFGDSPLSQSHAARISRSDAAFWRVTGPLFVGGFSTLALLYSVQPLMPVFAREFVVSPAVASLSPSATTTVLAIAMIGAGSGLPAVAMAHLGDEMDAQAIGLAMGLYIAGSTLGGMAGRLAVAALSDHAGWRAAIAAAGAVGLVGAALIGLALPATRGFSPRRPDLRGLTGALARHFSDPGLRLLFAESFLLMGSFVCAYNYTGFRLSAPPFSFSQTTIGFIFVLYLVGAVSSMVMGDLAGVAATLPDNIVAVVVGVGLITWGFFGAHSIASSWVGLRAHGARAQASALYLFFYYLGSSLIGSTGGVFFERLGWTGVAGLLAALTGAALVIALRLSKVPPPRQLTGR